jgi:hypothetical protein
MKLFYPDAQFPLAVPPLLEHSLEVKQVPFRTVLKKSNNHINEFWLKMVWQNY